jgi:hypothetical protein
VQHNLRARLGRRLTPGTSVPINNFFIASPTDSADKINDALRRGAETPS